jgi:CRP/FNR family transcriptional regulator, anaerobic regulatory protein
MASALEKRLIEHLPLTWAERNALDWLERRERRYEAGEIVLEQGQPTDCLYVVSEGWLHASTRLKDGGRQILRFYFVGDITTSFSIAWEYTASALTAVSESTLFEIPRPALGRLFAEHPRLGAMLYGIMASEHVAMSDRLTSVGRMNGMTRVATLLLDIRSRLRVIDGLSGSVFELPLTQQDLGDAVGLTKAHVNRSLKALEKTGLIERDGKVIRITNVEALAELVGFQDRHAHVAIDWLPPVRASDSSQRPAAE